MDKLYSLSPWALWSQFRKEHFAFWMICFYLVMEYVRPQSVHPGLDFLPWDKVFLGLALLALPLDPHRCRVRDATNLWMTLLLLAIIAASIFAAFPSISWSHWFDFFGWYVIYFLIISTVTTPERFFIFLVIFLLANFKLSLFGARTWISRGFGYEDWGIAGPPGFFENSSDLSTEMLMFAPIAFELALFVRSQGKRASYWFLLLGAITGVMTILAASSRGSQLGLAAQAVWVAIQRRLKLRILVSIALVAVIGYQLLPAAEKARFASVGTDNTSIQRLNYWEAGLKMIENHPVLGVGYFNFPAVYSLYGSNALWHGTAQLPHNIFIQVGTDAGLIGLGIFVMLIYRNLKEASDIRRACKVNPEAPAFAPGVARGLALATWGFVIAGQFNTVSYYPFLWINLALTVSLANVVRRAAQSPVSAAISPMVRQTR